MPARLREQEPKFSKPSLNGQPKFMPPAGATSTSSHWLLPTSAMINRPVGGSIWKRNGLRSPIAHTSRMLLSARAA